MEFFADLHIHSCLSPCGDDEMTPCNICGMAKIKGLDIIAITDHNTARNLPAAQEVCDAYGLLLLPGMEITTREEVHLLGYFPDVPTALEFSEMLRTHMPKGKNKPKFFGNQLVMNSDDEVIAEEDCLLIGASNFSLAEAFAFSMLPLISLRMGASCSRTSSFEISIFAMLSNSFYKPSQRFKPPTEAQLVAPD